MGEELEVQRRSVANLWHFLYTVQHGDEMNLARAACGIPWEVVNP
jgi:hypothetical protein